MRVVSWNVQHGRPNPDGPPDLSLGLPALAALGPDVCALQELDRGLARSDRTDQLALVADALAGTALAVPALERGEGSYGNGLVVRGELTDAAVLDLGGAEPRSAGLARVELDDGAWSIAVTHLSTHDDEAQAQLLVVLDALAERPEPLVLLGDLNLEPHQVEPAAVERRYHLVEGPPTWNARRRRPRRRLDHVVVRGAAVTASAAHQLPVSDHLAVSADLRRL